MKNKLANHSTTMITTTQMKSKILLQKINALLIIAIFAIAVIEFLADFISQSVFIRVLLIGAILAIIWIGIINTKFFNKLTSQIILFLIVATFNIFYSSFFYDVNGFLIVVPHNYTGSIYIRLGDQKSKHQDYPFNKIVVFATNSKGKFFTKSHYDLSLDQLSLAQFNNNDAIEGTQANLIDLKFLKHDSIDGKYNIIIGKVVLNKDSSSSK